MNLPSSYVKSLSISMPSEGSWRQINVTAADFNTDGTKFTLTASMACRDYAVCGLTGNGLCDKMVEETERNRKMRGDGEDAGTETEQ